MSDTATISVLCPCGKRLKAPASAAGRKAKCPSCGNVMIVEAPPPVLEADVLEEIEPDAEPSLDFLSNLDDLAAQESKAAAVAQANDVSVRCPNCLRSMTRGDMLCVSCGYDVRRGKVHNTTTVSAKPQRFLGLAAPKEAKKDKLAPQGSFVIGLLVSFAFAIVAAVPWFVVAYLTDRDFYILELLVGVAAGLGMQVGQKGYSSLGGWASAGMTFLVLIGVRIAVVIAVFIPLAIDKAKAAAADAAQRATRSAEEQEIADRDSRVATLLARQDLEAQRIDTDADLDDATVAKVKAAHKRAEEKLRKMSKDEYVALLPKVHQYEIRSALIERQIDHELRSMGLNPDFQRIEEHNWAKARENVTKRVDALTPAQQAAEMKKIDDRMIAEFQDEIARARAAGKLTPSEDPQSNAHGIGFVFGLLLVVAIMPLIFLVLSMAAAYRTAAGSVGG